VSNAKFTIAANSFPNANLVDVASNSTRRLKITTPFGIIVSDNNSSGTFSVSATPAYLGNAAATFAGGGYDGGSNTYDLSNGSLVINGSNFLGVRVIQLEDNSSNAYITTVVDPSAPPAGITFNSTGTQITITTTFINDNNASWANSSSLETMRVKLTTAADQSTTTPNITTTSTGTAGPIITSLSGTGFASSNFQRNGTLIVNGGNLSGVTSVTLVDLNGLEIAGITPISGGSLTITSTSVTIAADAFDTDGNETDTNATAGRRVKISTASSSLISSPNTPFTVSSTPDVSAVAATVYAGSASAAAGTGHVHTTGTGDILITAVGEDMNGVTLIDFWDTNTAAVRASTTQLKEGDWTVSADGRTITILKATITANGLNWYTPDSATALRAFRLTTAASVTTLSTAIRAQP
jgi:hypothetical protein